MSSKLLALQVAASIAALVALLTSAAPVELHFRVSCQSVVQNISWDNASAHVLVTIAGCSTVEAPRIRILALTRADGTFQIANVTVRFLNTSAAAQIDFVMPSPQQSTVSNVTILFEDCFAFQETDRTALGGFRVLVPTRFAAVSNMAVIMKGRSAVHCHVDGCVVIFGNVSGLSWHVMDRSTLVCPGRCMARRVVSHTEGEANLVAAWDFLVDNSTVESFDGPLLDIEARATYLVDISFGFRNRSTVVVLGVLRTSSVGPQLGETRAVQLLLYDSNLTLTQRRTEYVTALLLRTFTVGVTIHVVRSNWEVSQSGADLSTNSSFARANSAAFLLLEPPFVGSDVFFSVESSNFTVTMVYQMSLTLGMLVKSDTSAVAQPSNNITNIVVSVRKSTFRGGGPGRLSMIYMDRSRISNASFFIADSRIDLRNMLPVNRSAGNVSRESVIVYFAAKFPSNQVQYALLNCEVSLIVHEGTTGLPTLASSVVSVVSVTEGNDTSVHVERSNFVVRLQSPPIDVDVPVFAGTVELIYFSHFEDSPEMLNAQLNRVTCVVRDSAFDVFHTRATQSNFVLFTHLTFFLNVQQIAVHSMSVALTAVKVRWTTELPGSQCLAFGFVALRNGIFEDMVIRVISSDIRFNSKSTCALLTATNVDLRWLNFTAIDSIFESSISQLNFILRTLPTALILIARVWLSATTPTLVPTENVSIELVNSSFVQDGQNVVGILATTPEVTMQRNFFWMSNCSFTLPSVSGYELFNMPMRSASLDVQRVSRENAMVLACNGVATRTIKPGSWLRPRLMSATLLLPAWGKISVALPPQPRSESASVLYCSMNTKTETLTGNWSRGTATISSSFTMCPPAGVTAVRMCGEGSREGDALALYTGTLVVAIAFNTSLAADVDASSWAVAGANVRYAIMSNETELHVGLSSPPGEFVLRLDKFVTLSISPNSFSCPPPNVLKSVLSVPAVAYSTAPAVRFAASATVAATMIFVSPALLSAALSQQRSTMMLSLGTCAYSHSEPLDPSSSPTQMGLGPAEGRYFRGAVVGNTLVFAAGAALCFVLAFARKGRMCLSESLADLGLPGRLALLHAALLTPTVTAGVGAALYGGSGFWDAVFYGALVAGVLWIALPVAVVVTITTRQFEARPVRKKVSSSAPARALMRMRPEVEWVAKKNKQKRGCADVFVGMWGELFTPYSGSFQWFLAVEILQAAAAGVIGGVMSNSETVCARVQLSALLLALTSLGALILVRPVNETTDFAAALLQGFLNATSCFALVAGASEVSDAVAIVSIYLTAAAAAVSVVQSLLSIAQEVRRGRNSILGELGARLRPLRRMGRRSKSFAKAEADESTMPPTADRLRRAIHALEALLAMEVSMDSPIHAETHRRAALKALVELACCSSLLHQPAAGDNEREAILPEVDPENAH